MIRRLASHSRGAPSQFSEVEFVCRPVEKRQYSPVLLAAFGQFPGGLLIKLGFKLWMVKHYGQEAFAVTTGNCRIRRSLSRFTGLNEAAKAHGIIGKAKFIELVLSHRSFPLIIMMSI